MRINLKAFGYFEGDLIIIYSNHTKYIYKNVGFGIYKNFQKAKNKGRFLAKYIKPKYNVERV